MPSDLHEMGVDEPVTLDMPSVRCALKLCCDPFRLGLHPLTKLCLVAEQQVHGHTNPQLEAGQALRQCLLNALESLRPSEDQADLHQQRRYRILLDHYVNRKLRHVVADQVGLHISAYYEEQRYALLQVVSILSQWESDARSRAKQTDTNVIARVLPCELALPSGTHPVVDQLCQWLLADQPVIGVVGKDDDIRTQHIAKLIRDPTIRRALETASCMLD